MMTINDQDSLISMEKTPVFRVWLVIAGEQEPKHKHWTSEYFESMLGEFERIEDAKRFGVSIAKQRSPWLMFLAGGWSVLLAGLFLLPEIAQCVMSH